jgi:hypothetical protein
MVKYTNSLLDAPAAAQEYVTYVKSTDAQLALAAGLTVTCYDVTGTPNAVLTGVGSGSATLAWYASSTSAGPLTAVTNPNQPAIVKFSHPSVNPFGTEEKALMKAKAASSNFGAENVVVSDTGVILGGAAVHAIRVEFPL